MQQRGCPGKNGAALAHQSAALAHEPLNAAPVHEICLACAAASCSAACLCQSHEATGRKCGGQFKIAFCQFEIGHQHQLRALKGEAQQGLGLICWQIPQGKAKAHAGQRGAARKLKLCHAGVERRMGKLRWPGNPPRKGCLGK